MKTIYRFVIIVVLISISVTVFLYHPVFSENCKKISKDNFSVTHSWDSKENKYGSGAVKIEVNSTGINGRNLKVRGDWRLNTSNNTVSLTHDVQPMVNGTVIGGNSEWAILPKPDINSNTGCFEGFIIGQERINNESGFFVGNELVLIGNVSYAETRKVNGRNITLIDSGSKKYNSQENLTDIWKLMKYSTNVTLNPDSNQKEILLYVLSDSYHSGITFYRESGPNEIYVKGSAGGTGSIPNTYVHEYIHTQQKFQTSKRMSWIREGSAQYLSAMIVYEENKRLSRSDVADNFVLNFTGPLDEPDYWRGTDLPYSKGGKTLVKLDLRIQNATCGRKTFLNLFQWMNTVDSEITVNKTANKIRRMAGSSTSKWFRESVESSEVVNIDKSDVPKSMYGHKCDKR